MNLKRCFLESIRASIRSVSSAFRFDDGIGRFGCVPYSSNSHNGSDVDKVSFLGLGDLLLRE
jgi:hypothetical protein